MNHIVPSKSTSWTLEISTLILITTSKSNSLVSTKPRPSHPTIMKDKAVAQARLVLSGMMVITLMQLRAKSIAKMSTLMPHTQVILTDMMSQCKTVHSSCKLSNTSMTNYSMKLSHRLSVGLSIAI